MEDTRTNLEKAEALAARLEEANKQSLEILQRQEALAVETKLSGQTNGGQIPIEPKEETPQEYAQKILRGEQ